MKAIISNNSIILENPTKDTYRYFEELCFYKDKAAAYSAVRLSKSYYLRNSSYAGTAQRQNVLNQIVEIKDKINNQILVKIDKTSWQMPAGFVSHLYKIHGLEIVDNRNNTGGHVPMPWVKRPYDLRDYQAEAVSLMEANYRGIINLSTGLGKTLLAIHAVKNINKRTLILCPGEFIARQFEVQLIGAFGTNKVCFYGDGQKKTNRPIIVGIVNSVNNDIEKFKDLDLGLIIFDEVHRMACDTIYNIATNLSHVGKIFGLTATNYRNDGKDILLEAACGETLIERDTIWGIENKWLAKPIFYIQKIKAVGDYKDNKDKNYKANVLNSIAANKMFIDDIKSNLAEGRRVLCLVDQVAHGKFLAANTDLPFVTGQDKNSDLYVKAFNKGEVQGLIATDSKIGEGADLPAIDCLIFANFTASKVAVIQCLGRGLRPFPGKTECKVYDYAVVGCDMFERHSLLRLGYYKEITADINLLKS